MTIDRFITALLKCWGIYVFQFAPYAMLFSQVICLVVVTDIGHIAVAEIIVLYLELFIIRII